MLITVLLLIWILAIVVFGVWSLMAWGLNALLVAGASNAPAVESTIRSWLSPFPFLENWVPAIMSAVQAGTQFLASMGGWVPAAIWVVWAIGVVIILVPAVLGSALAVWGIRRLQANQQTQLMAR